MRQRALDIVGIGNAVVDVLAHVDDAFVARHGMVKGAMTLIDVDRARALQELMGPAVECSGGSAANTMVGLASLGGRAGFIGKVRDDALGSVFTRDIRSAGVEFDTPPARSGPGTGRCLIFVSPDAQRTLQTYLGASSGLGPEDVDVSMIRRARYTYLEGYLWDPPPAKEAFLKAARAAHDAGGRVALSLSDPLCVERHRESFLELIREHVDVLFANEAEITALYRAGSFDEAISRLGGQCELAALTRGELGSVVVTGEAVHGITAEPVAELVDTTGAGDLYASGFLFGLTRGHDPRECGRIGSIAAAEVIGHMGARPRSSLAELLARRAGEGRR
jgi:sugar/nucleoside kinase (ribokinase family)